MATYAEYYTPNLFFITQTAVGNETLLSTTVMVRLLRSALHWVQERHPFQMVGYVFLPTHIHLLVEPTAGTVLDPVMAGMRRQFQLEYGELFGMPGETLLWEATYAARQVIDVDDFAHQLDFIHYRPVQQKLVACPELWPHSSYLIWQARGVYSPEWGWTRPPTLDEKGR